MPYQISPFIRQQKYIVPFTPCEAAAGYFSSSVLLF
jgi:hypothetical protein